MGKQGQGVAAPAAGAGTRRERQGRELLEALHQQFAAVEWVQPEKFWTARVLFGERDYAVITVVSAELVTRVLVLLAELQDTFGAVLRAGDAGEAAAQAGQVLAGALDTRVWPLLTDIWACCVSEMDLPELRAATGVDHGGATVAEGGGAAGLARKLHELPIVLLGRVLVGIAVQAGNLLTRSSKD